MALIECPECGKQVSDQAVSCPGCGFPLSQMKDDLDAKSLDEEKADPGSSSCSVCEETFQTPGDDPNGREVPRPTMTMTDLTTPKYSNLQKWFMFILGAILFLILVSHLNNTFEQEGAEREAANNKELKSVDMKISDMNYKIVSEDPDKSYKSKGRLIVRKVIRITVKDGLSREELRANLEHAAWSVFRKQRCNAVMVFAYRKGDETTGVFTAGKAVLAPNGKWGNAEEFQDESQLKTTVELADLYFKKGTNSKKKTSAKLFSKDNSKVAISKVWGNWGDENVIVRVPPGKKVKILETKRKAMSQSFELVRIKISLNYNGKRYVGWVHDYNLKMGSN